MGNAPSINILSKEARAAGEAAERAQDAARPAPGAQEQLEHLRQVERKTRPGAMPRTPKQSMLDSAEEYARAFPDRHFRWVNVGNTDKASNSILNGYSQHKDSLGNAVQRGNLQLWSCPKEMFEERRAEREARTAASLDVDANGRRGDSGEFYQEVDKVSSLVRSRGHRASRPEHIIKDSIDGPIGG